MISASQRFATTVPVADLERVAAQWRSWRRLYPFYVQLALRAGLQERCPELETPTDRGDAVSMACVLDWFRDLDQRIGASDLRLLLQTTALGTEENLRALIAHFLAKPQKAASDRDKVDFLLVQYFAACAPHSMHTADFGLDEVAYVMEPVVGEAVPLEPAWLAPLNEAVAELSECRSLRDLLERRILYRIRELKNSSGQMFFGSAAMLAFTRFNFQMRRAFFRLLRADLDFIRHGLRELELRGVDVLECAGTRLAQQESLTRLREICNSWQEPFRAAYAAGHAFEELVAIRTVVEQALATTPVGSAEEALPVEGTAVESDPVASMLCRPQLCCTGERLP
jgi:hypothetical protein